MELDHVVSKVLSSGNNEIFANILWGVSQITNIPVSDSFAKEVADSIMRVRWNVTKV
jgi:hypothetical protein